MDKKELQKAQNIIDILFYDDKALTQWQHTLLENVISIAQTKLRQPSVSGSFCQCKKLNYSYTVPVCNKCNCVVDFSAKLPITTKLANKHINNNEQRKYNTIIPR